MTRLRLAIASPGIGLVQRGFERLMRDIFELEKTAVDAVLFKGGGPARDREVRLRFIHRNGRLLRVVPLHRLIGRTPLHVECLTFALALMPHLIARRIELVHVIDPPLARILWHLRRILRLNFRLLYTEGCAMPPGDYPPADHIHQISPVTLADAVAHGHPAADMTLLPCGLYPERFRPSARRAELRAKHGIADDTFVVVSVAAINRGHKRTHHLIDEVAGLNGDVLLWLDGSLDHGDPDLLDIARARLGDRLRVTHLPSVDVGDLYHLADIMPHAALFEAFGIALVEAAAAGLPVLVHDAPHFRWLIDRPACWLDMAAPGALRARLAALIADRSALAALRCPDATLARYAWPVLAPGYRQLYEAVGR